MALDLAARSAIAFVESLETRPIHVTESAEALHARLARALPQGGTPAYDVITQLVRDVEPGVLGSASGRFFAWVIGGTLPSALAADWLTSAWDQNAAIFATSPSAAVVEATAGAWLKELLGLPACASFAFVTGIQMAHATCLAAARHALLHARDWNVEARGLYGAPQIRVLSSAYRHASIDRALRLLGMGTESLQVVASTPEETLDPDALDAALRHEPDTPAIVLLQAGDLNTGAFDDFQRIIPIAKRHDAWVHVDGAFGLWAAASPNYSHLIAGAEGADSWTTDGHKWLNVPYDCGYAFVVDSAAHAASMSIRAAYFHPTAASRDEIDWNPEWSRRARAIPTYAALQELGREGVAAMVERSCRHAKNLVDELARLPGVEVLWHPIINQGLVRFGDDARTEYVIERVAASGEAFFGPTTWHGMRAMRVSVVNWRTSDDDVSRAVEAVRQILA
jgi:glutamate/tyrosine decarboxylase-like PLP-dependent enzyme